MGVRIMTRVMFLLLVLTVAIPTSFAGKNDVLDFETWTGEGPDCDMDEGGSITVTVWWRNGEACTTLSLTNSSFNEDAFEEGQRDKFRGEQLGECLATDFGEEDNAILKFQVQHHGVDSWCLGNFCLHYDNGFGGETGKCCGFSPYWVMENEGVWDC